MTAESIQAKQSVWLIPCLRKYYRGVPKYRMNIFYIAPLVSFKTVASIKNAKGSERGEG